MHFATKQWVGYDPAATHEALGIGRIASGGPGR
jgi:hypothetical protein